MALEIPKTYWLILDGWGMAPPSENNAIAKAATPNFDALMRDYPNTELASMGSAVGLPEGQIGNSEVGHNNLGAGRVVYQDLLYVNESIEDGTFFDNRVLMSATENVKKRGSKLHLMGLYSDGGVHSHKDHVFALLELAKKEGVSEVELHLFLDGQDSPPFSGIDFVRELKARMKEIGVGHIASISGRFYSMDRVNQWGRSAKVYNAIVHADAPCYGSAEEAIQKSYEAGFSDNFVKPICICDREKPVLVEDGDSIVFFNLRSDRARQLTKAFIDEDFKGFDRRGFLSDVHFVAMTDFGDNLNVDGTAFLTPKIENTVAEVLSRHNGVKQAYVAESEKYPHITYFFHGSNSRQFGDEDWIRVPSPDIRNYVETPEMSASKITEQITSFSENGYNFFVVNYANADMVAHTGDFEATVKAVEAIDRELGKVVDAVRREHGVLLVTADHGNAEDMQVTVDNQHKTAHSPNPVPLVIADFRGQPFAIGSLGSGALGNVAPTLLEVIGVEKPEEMTSKSLIVKS